MTVLLVAAGIAAAWGLQLLVALLPLLMWLVLGGSLLLATGSTVVRLRRARAGGGRKGTQLAAASWPAVSTLLMSQAMAVAAVGHAVGLGTVAMVTTTPAVGVAVTGGTVAGLLRRSAQRLRKASRSVRCASSESVSSGT